MKENILFGLFTGNTCTCLQRFEVYFVSAWNESYDIITTLHLCRNVNLQFVFFFQFSPMTRLYDPTRKKEATGTPQFSSERETCLGFFERWSEQDQIDFVEHLLSRMCHYQHGHINTYLKPMLQRDFISLLPSERFIHLAHILV